MSGVCQCWHSGWQCQPERSTHYHAGLLEHNLNSLNVQFCSNKSLKNLNSCKAATSSSTSGVRATYTEVGSYVFKPFRLRRQPPRTPPGCLRSSASCQHTLHREGTPHVRAYDTGDEQWTPPRPHCQPKGTSQHSLSARPSSACHPRSDAALLASAHTASMSPGRRGPTR